VERAGAVRPGARGKRGAGRLSRAGRARDARAVDGWKGVVVMRHLRLANVGREAVAAQQPKSEICLLDYSSCTQSDVRWLADLDDNCDMNDGCIIDVS
jgi:hypothetical protein